MKLYTFVTDSGEVIEQVRAENFMQATEAATDPRVNSTTEFYSEWIEEPVHATDDYIDPEEKFYNDHTTYLERHCDDY